MGSHAPPAHYRRRGGHRPRRLGKRRRGRRFLCVALVSVAVAAAFFLFAGVTVDEAAPAATTSRPLEHDDRCTNRCLWTTGAAGAWIRDWDFAAKHGQYPAPRVHPNGPYLAGRDRAFRPSPEAPFPWRTSWRWHDRDADCPIDDALTHEELCRVLSPGNLDVDAIAFYGDSIAEGMYHALLNKLGPVHVRTEAEYDNILCDNNTRIRVYHERDHGGNAFPRSPRGAYSISEATRAFLHDTRKAIAIFNIGAHYHNFTHYEEDIRVLLDGLPELYRPDDIYFFRSTSPGHPNCEPRTKDIDWSVGPKIIPLQNYSEYDPGTAYDWNQFERYNDYTRRAILRYNADRDRTPVHYLNIWNMTVYRHDAHTAPADCLHFHDPGPTDWWNHLLFTYLQNLAHGTAAGNCRRLDL